MLSTYTQHSFTNNFASVVVSHFCHFSATVYNTRHYAGQRNTHPHSCLWLWADVTHRWLCLFIRVKCCAVVVECVRQSSGRNGVAGDDAEMVHGASQVHSQSAAYVFEKHVKIIEVGFAYWCHWGLPIVYLCDPVLEINSLRHQLRQLKTFLFAQHIECVIRRWQCTMWIY